MTSPVYVVDREVLCQKGGQSRLLLDSDNGARGNFTFNPTWTAALNPASGLPAANSGNVKKSSVSPSTGSRSSNSRSHSSSTPASTIGTSHAAIE